MLLHDLLGAVDVLELHAGPSRAVPPNPDVSSVAHDSRRVDPGALFCCIPGHAADGHDRAPEALARGAVALAVERILPLDVPQARVADVRAAVGPLAARCLGEPSRAMLVLGVTGTNGKTSVTYLLEAIGRAAGMRTGMIGTTGVRIGDETLPTGFTTPEATDLQAILARMRDERVDLVAMEVSSHALAQHRVDGTRFAAVGFTNLGRDHLDLHGSMAEYRAAKASLFTGAFADVAVVNGDVEPLFDPAAVGVPTRRYSTGSAGDVRAGHIVEDATGTGFVLHLEGDGTRPQVSLPVRLPRPGRFNVENALCAAGMALAVGLAPEPVVAGLEAAVLVPGRLERVDAGGAFAVYVDYAHTPEGLATVLDAARGVAGDGRVLALFGCGGDRDPGKRAPMGRAVGTRADAIVLTSDNPRSEDPEAIAAAAEEGLRAAGARYEVELDRRTAIRRVLAQAGPGDVVLVLGKGSEQGQITRLGCTPFDDRVVVREELEALA